MKKVLWVSLKAPYDKVDHAGGKVHNYYLKEMHKSGKFDIKLFSYCSHEEKNKIDLDEYGISNNVVCYDYYDKCDMFRKIINIESKINIFNKNVNIISNYRVMHLKKYLNRLKKEGYTPDLVIMEWTQMIFQIDLIKSYFPNAKYVSIEEDVTFLSYERRIDKSTLIKKVLSNYRFVKIKQLELKALQKSDVVIVNNYKDLDLLLEENINKDKCFVSVPYFDKFKINNNDTNKKNLIFYGAMARPENYESVIWFIENVFDQLDSSYNLYVVGSKPPKKLLDYQNDRIIVTGFVDTPAPYFEKCSILVAPLLLGAGIKIKILEALYMGKIVLTNEIGIEGIPAKDKEVYFHCENAQDYINTIRMVQDIDVEKMSNCAKSFMDDNFSLEQKTYELIELLSKI